LPLKEAAAKLSFFKGTGRRFEVKGEKRGVTVIDDYAHHPTEIKATLAAARARYPGSAFGPYGSLTPIPAPKHSFLNLRGLSKMPTR